MVHYSSSDAARAESAADIDVVSGLQIECAQFADLDLTGCTRNAEQGIGP